MSHIRSGSPGRQSHSPPCFSAQKNQGEKISFCHFERSREISGVQFSVAALSERRSQQGVIPTNAEGSLAENGVMVYKLSHAERGGHQVREHRGGVEVLQPRVGYAKKDVGVLRRET